MRNIQVLQIGKYYHPYVGGTESHLVTLVSELKKRVDVTVLVSNTNFKTSVETDGQAKIYRIGSFGKIFSLSISLSMPIWLKRFKADILHFHIPNPLSIISYFISRPKGKIVVSYHSDIVRQKFLAFLFKPLLIGFLKKAEAIIVTSDNLIENSDILARFRTKCKVIPHGIDINRFAPNEETIKKSAQLRQEHGTPIVLFVGRLVYYKGLEFLINAIKDIKAKLLVVGDGPLKNRLNRLTDSLGLCDKVVWVGRVEDEELASYYYGCDMLVLPSSSKAESFGIVQLEAFACAKPVVSTDLPTGVPFVNLNGITGIVVPPRNSTALSAAINTLLKSPDICRGYGRKARQRVETEFTKEQMADRVIAIYKGL